MDDPGTYIASPYVANQDDIFVRVGGHIEPIDAPGLGVELDEELTEEHRLN